MMFTNRFSVKCSNLHRNKTCSFCSSKPGRLVRSSSRVKGKARLYPWGPVSILPGALLALSRSNVANNRASGAKRSLRPSSQKYKPWTLATIRPATSYLSRSIVWGREILQGLINAKGPDNKVARVIALLSIAAAVRPCWKTRRSN